MAAREGIVGCRIHRELRVEELERRVSPALVYQTLPWPEEDFSSLPGEEDGWTYYSSSGGGRIQIADGALRMDSTDGYVVNEAILHLDLAGAGNLQLQFDHRDSTDEYHSLPAPRTDWESQHYDGDGVAISDDGGVTWSTVMSLGRESAWTTHTIDLDMVISLAGMSYSSTFLIKFQQYDNQSWGVDGREFDNISVQEIVRAPINYTQDFSGGKPGEEDGWEYYSSESVGRIEVVNGALRTDSAGGYVLNEAILQLNLAEQSGVQLQFDHRDNYDEAHAMPEGTFTGHPNSDGVAISNDGGTTWYTLESLGRQLSWTTHVIDLDAAVAAAGWTYTSTFCIKFQQYDNCSWAASDGREFDNIVVTRPPKDFTLYPDEDGESFAYCYNGMARWITAYDADENAVVQGTWNAGSGTYSIAVTNALDTYNSNDVDYTNFTAPSIGSVAIGSSVFGTFTLSSFGANDVLDINGVLNSFTITGAGGLAGDLLVNELTGTITTGAGGITASGSITTDGDFNDIAVGGAMEGKLMVGGDLIGAMYVDEDITGPIEIWGDLSGTITAINITGAITVTGNMTGEILIEGDLIGVVDVNGDITGPIDICGSLGGTLSAVGSIADAEIVGAVGSSAIVTAYDFGVFLSHSGFGGSLTVTGNLTGLLNVLGGDLTGTVSIVGDMTSTSSLYLDGDLTGSLSANNIAGNIFILGYVTETGSFSANASITAEAEIEIVDGLAGIIHAVGDMDGSILVSFGDISGLIQADGNAYGSIATRHNLSGLLLADNFGYIEVGDHVTEAGDITATGEIYAGGDPGEILSLIIHGCNYGSIYAPGGILHYEEHGLAAVPVVIEPGGSFQFTETDGDVVTILYTGAPGSSITVAFDNSLAPTAIEEIRYMNATADSYLRVEVTEIVGDGLTSGGLIYAEDQTFGSIFVEGRIEGFTGGYLAEDEYVCTSGDLGGMVLQGDERGNIYVAGDMTGGFSLVGGDFYGWMAVAGDILGPEACMIGGSVFGNIRAANILAPMTVTGAVRGGDYRIGVENAIGAPMEIGSLEGRLSAGVLASTLTINVGLPPYMGHSYVSIGVISNNGRLVVNGEPLGIGLGDVWGEVSCAAPVGLSVERLFGTISTADAYSVGFWSGDVAPGGRLLVNGNVGELEFADVMGEVSVSGSVGIAWVDGLWGSLEAGAFPDPNPDPDVQDTVVGIGVHAGELVSHSNNNGGLYIEWPAGGAVTPVPTFHYEYPDPDEPPIIVWENWADYLEGENATPGWISEVDLDIVWPYQPYVADEDEDTIGAIMGINRDDDDHDGIEDRYDPFVLSEVRNSPLVFGEDDLLTLWLAEPQLSSGQIPVGALSLTYDDAVVRVYADPIKEHFIASGSELDLRMSYPLWVEGVGGGSTLITASWTAGAAFDAVRVNVMVIDLGIVKQGFMEEVLVPDGEDLTKGYIINVNIDDDDNDGGTGAHGVVTIYSDNDEHLNPDDVPGVTKGDGSGDDDLVKLKLNALTGLPAEGEWQFRLSWESNKIKLWKSDHKRPEDAVVSGVTEFDATEDAFVWVEGLSPSEPGGGEFITLKAYKDGEEFVGAQDTVKIRVAEMMFAIYGHGSTEESRENLETYLDQVNGDDPRTDPYIIDAGDYCYSVYIWDTEKGFKIALQAEDSYVVFEGHTRFYFGEPADLHDLNQFMNVGDSMIDISLYRACLPASEGGFGYNLEVPAGSYGGEAPNYGVWKYRVEVDYTDCDLDGNLKTGHFYATHFSLDEPFEGPLGQEIYDKEYVILQSWIPGNPLGDFHYIKEDQELPEEMWHRLVVDWSSADLPNVAYSKLFLNTCESSVYYNHFNHGAVFFTTSIAAHKETTREFVKSIIQYRNSDDLDRDILWSLNDKDWIHGYIK